MRKYCCRYLGLYIYASRYATVARRGGAVARGIPPPVGSRQRQGQSRSREAARGERQTLVEGLRGLGEIGALAK